MKSLRSGMLLLTLVLAIGCVRSVAPARDASRLQLADRVTYQHYDAPRRGTGGGLPLAVSIDAKGNAWILGEFHSELQHVRVSDSGHQTRRVGLPHHPDVRPFTNLQRAATQESVLGESVIVDSDGRVWLSQGGGHLVREGTNHSRVVSYEPERHVVRAYNLPGNRNEAMGLLWDDARGLVWVAESGMHAARATTDRAATDEDPRAGALIAFDPATTPHDNEFQWNQPLDHLVCAESSPEPQSCFARYRLPDGARAPAHLAGDASGAIWFTLFWGAAIGRLEPETGDVIIYPLQAGVGNDLPAQIVGPGPWDIAISPDGEHVVWSEFFDSEVARIPLARALDPSCRALHKGINPCVEEVPVPSAPQGRQRVHSIAFDGFGNLWFTQFSFKAGPDVQNSIGFVTSSWSHVRLLEPFGDREGHGPSYTGIAIDHDTGDIWVAEFKPPGVGRLELVNRNVDPATW